MKFNDDAQQNIFKEFVRAGNNQNEIKQLYEMLPFATSQQQKVLVMFKTFAKKYESEVFAEMAKSIEDLIKDNRRLGWSFKRLIEAISLHKYFKGYKASASVNENKEG